MIIFRLPVCFRQPEILSKNQKETFMLKKFALLTILLPVFANASWLQERRCDQINEVGFAIGVYTAQCGVSVDEIQQKYAPRVSQALDKHSCAQYNDKSIVKLKQNADTLRTKYLKKASAPNFCANYDAEINKLLRKHE